MDRVSFFLFVPTLLMFVIGCGRATPTSNAGPNKVQQETLPTEQTAAIDSEDAAFDAKAITQVPELVGIPGDWAMQLLRLKHLQGVEGRLYLPADNWQAEWAEGRVYLQTPQPVTAINPNAYVAFWTVHRADADDALVEVPNVIGTEVDKAKTALEEDGLAVMIVPRAPAEGEESRNDVVLDQFPRASQILGPSSTVLLHVASQAVSN